MFLVRWFWLVIKIIKHWFFVMTGRKEQVQIDVPTNIGIDIH